MGLTDLPAADPRPLQQKHEIRPRKLEKARTKRQAQKVVTRVRAACVERDGHCRIGEWENNPCDLHDGALTGDGQPVIGCEGRSEWAHLGAQKRFKTRGQPATTRHTTAGSLMLCQRHHRDYDAGRMEIVGDNADGVLDFSYRQQWVRRMGDWLLSVTWAACGGLIVLALTLAGWIR